MADHAIPFEYLPDPINFFQNTPVEAGGSIAYGAASIDEAGDMVGVWSTLTCMLATWNGHTGTHAVVGAWAAN